MRVSESDHLPVLRWHLFLKRLLCFTNYSQCERNSIFWVHNKCHITQFYNILVSHYITLHYITLHYITLHYITLHYITLHYITLHYITLHYRYTWKAATRILACVISCPPQVLPSWPKSDLFERVRVINHNSLWLQPMAILEENMCL